MKKLLALFLLALLCVLGLSCATHRIYDGDPRPKDQVAVIKMPVGTFGTQITVDNIDGRSHANYHGDMEVLPGRHKLTVLVQRGSTMAAHNLSFDALAGHVYRLEADPSLLCTIVDDATGANVTLPQDPRP